MKKWKVVISLFVIFILFIQVYRLYATVQEGQENLQQIAINRALQETELVNVDNVSFFHGSKAYQVVTGTNEAGESLIVWVPEDKKQKTIVKSKDEGWTKEQVRDHVLTERDPLTIKEIRLGIENNKPLWEITYIDQKKRFTYYYIDFESGEFLKRYSLTNKPFKGDF